MQIKISDNLMELAKLVNKKYPLYVVGGYVRNQLFKKSTGDIDICGPAMLSELRQMFFRTEFVLSVKNEKFGTATITCGNESYEYATFRLDLYSEERPARHSPDEVVCVDDLVLDLPRRDFTINAIYYDIQHDKLIDLKGGLSDMQNKILRMIEPHTLKYDGMRIFRLARFAKEYELTVEENTYKEAIKHSGNADKIFLAKAWKEIEKIKNIKCSKTYEGYFKKLCADLNLNKYL